MKYLKNIFLAFVFIIVSCTNLDYETLEKQAWDDLYNLNIEQAYPKFKKLLEVRKTDKNTLGLAYSEAILEKGNYYSTLKENLSNIDDVYQFGMMAAGFKVYYKNGGKDMVDFTMEEFKVLHEGGKFEIKRDGNVIIGEYENLKPKGIWEFYTLDRKLIRKVDSKVMFKMN